MNLNQLVINNFENYCHIKSRTEDMGIESVLFDREELEMSMKTEGWDEQIIAHDYLYKTDDNVYEAQIVTNVQLDKMFNLTIIENGEVIHEQR